MNIADIIKELAGKSADNILFATVTSVDATEKTCEVVTLADEMTLFDIRLIANNGDGVLITPTEGSVIGVCMINEVEGFVSLYSQVDSIQFGDGSFDGLIKIGELVTKINEIEDLLTSLVTKFNSHIHTTTATVGATAVLGVIAPTTSTESGSVTNTTQSEIENDKITHGDF